MKVTRTVICKLSEECENGFAALQDTLLQFAAACNYIREQAIQHETTSQYPLQKLTYQMVRVRYGLTANLAVRAVARVAAAFGRKKNIPKAFAPTSVDYDARIFSFREKDWTVSLSTVNGRTRYGLAIGEYQRGMLRGQNPTAATLALTKDHFFLHIQVTIDVALSPDGEVIGVDRGIKTLAATSTARHFGGKEALHRRRTFHFRRAALQRKGTKAAKRQLKRLAGKEARWMSHVNHCLSKELVADAQRHGASTLVLEDLKGIRSRAYSKKLRKTVSLWNFHQLECFLTYKANIAGMSVAKVDPAYTSQTCSRCGNVLKSQRRGIQFQCASCGYRNHADLNAAFNIRDRHVLSRLGRSNAPKNDPTCGSSKPREYEG